MARLTQQATSPCMWDFFNPDLVNQLGIGPILMGLGAQVQESLDVLMQDGLRNLLFGPPLSGWITNGCDPAALDIQRGHDHGLPDYNTTRLAFGLSAIDSFEQLTSNATVSSLLSMLYGSLDDLDQWVGLLAEHPLTGASLGPLNHALWRDQFLRSREGDRLFFWNDPDFLPGGCWASVGCGASDIQDITLASIIHRHRGFRVGLDGNAFFAVVPEPTAAMGLLGIGLGLLGMRARGGRWSGNLTSCTRMDQAPQGGWRKEIANRLYDDV